MNINKYKLYMELDKHFDIDYQVKKPVDLHKFCIDNLHIDRECEEIILIFGLDNTKHITCVFEVSRGVLNSSMTSPREIFKRLIIANCHSFIMVHNHFGDENPSNEDCKLYNQLKDCGNILGIPILDNIIIKGDDYYSTYDREERR